jgi:hypothetical protein
MKMNKILKIICFTILYFNTLCVNSQDIFSKDSVNLGDRKIFISICERSVNSNSVKLKDFEIETHQYCTCMTENLLPTFNSWELKQKIIDIMNNDESIKIILNCYKEYSTPKDHYKYDSVNFNPILLKRIKQDCIDEVLKHSKTDSRWNEKRAVFYCDCFYSEVFNRKLTQKELTNEDENSIVNKEITIPCIEKALIEK